MKYLFLIGMFFSFSLNGANLANQMVKAYSEYYLGDAKKALEIYENISVDSLEKEKQAILFFNRSLCYLRLDQREKAMENLIKAIEGKAIFSSMEERLKEAIYLLFQGYVEEVKREDLIGYAEIFRGLTLSTFFDDEKRFKAFFLEKEERYLKDLKTFQPSKQDPISLIKSGIFSLIERLKEEKNLLDIKSFSKKFVVSVFDFQKESYEQGVCQNVFWEKVLEHFLKGYRFLVFSRESEQKEEYRQRVLFAISEWEKALFFLKEIKSSSEVKRIWEEDADNLKNPFQSQYKEYLVEDLYQLHLDQKQKIQKKQSYQEVEKPW